MDATFNKIDWNLLIFFASLFILVRAFDNEFSEYAWKAIAPFLAVDKNPAKIVMFPLLLLVGSNILSLFIFVYLCSKWFFLKIIIWFGIDILSNVPLVLLLSSHLLEQNAPDFTWTLMAFVSTVAGNFSMLLFIFINCIIILNINNFYSTSW